MFFYLISLSFDFKYLKRKYLICLQNDNLEMMAVVKRMQIQYQEILVGLGEGDMFLGQMFLMGFNGLFIRLEDEFIGLMEVMDLLKVFEVWRKVDVVREGKVMQVLGDLIFK